jgi:enoyl-CoA hydratase
VALLTSGNPSATLAGMSNGIAYRQIDGIGELMINRPEARNSLNFAAQAEFAERVAALATASDLRALIVTGSGDKAFVSGGDLRELAEGQTHELGESLHRVMTGALDALTRLPVPVIAAVNGDAVGGGCEILTACDLRLGADHARLRFAQVAVGLTTGWGGTARLVRLVGQSQAMALLLRPRPMTAEEALRTGLLHHVVPAGLSVREEALRWASELAALPRDALAAAKYLVHAAAAESPEVVAELERRLFLALWAKPDHLEAIRAFLEKRPPRFGASPAKDSGV